MPAKIENDTQEAEAPIHEPFIQPPHLPAPVLPEMGGDGVAPATRRPQRERKPNQWLNADTWDLSGVDMNDTILHTILGQMKS